MGTTPNERYTLADVGCYVDGARGIYATDRIIEIAIEHGMEALASCECGQHLPTAFNSDYAGCEFIGEVEDEVDSFMNSQHAVDGAFWGRSEQGDWGLWTTDD
jgi:hypothetical protein